MPHEIGSMGWFEHHSGNSAKVKDYYAKVMNWEMEATDMEDHEDFTAMVDGDPVLGLIQSYPGLEDYSGWLPYFIVEDVEASLAKAIAEGGQEVVPLEVAEGYGAFAIVRDPSGALFSLFQPDDSDDEEEEEKD